MFGIIKSFLANPVRAKADNFIENLDVSNLKSKENHAKSVENYNDIYNNAYSNLVHYVSDPDNESLFESVLQGFEKCISLKPSQPEGYFYLSYIFHICEENTLAIKYLNTVKFISPDFDGLNILESDINNSLLKEPLTKENSQEKIISTLDMNTKKPEIKRIHYTDLKKKTI